MHTWFLNSTWSFREPFPGSDNFSVNPFGAGPSSVKVSVVGVGRKPDVNKNGETELKNNIQRTFLFSVSTLLPHTSLLFFLRSPADGVARIL